MHVTIHNEGTLLLEILDKALSLHDLRVKYLSRGLPSAIQVSSRQTASVVAVDYPVGVKHRNDLENELLSEDVSLRGLTNQKIDGSLHHPARIGLPRVHSCGQKHTLSLGFGIWVVLRSDCQVVYFVPSDGPAE